jgi:secondary thiamine-phosphate synthase enzyme
MTFFTEIPVQTQRRSHWVDLTGRVREAVAGSGVRSGVCSVSSPHTTAGVTLNENADPDVATDFFTRLERMAPQDDADRHAEGNSDSHLKATLVGFSVQVPVREGALVLGTWQAVYFCEFDGPRKLAVHVMVMGEP